MAKCLCYDVLMRYLAAILLLAAACANPPLSPLALAARTGRLDDIHTLIRQGADPDLPSGRNGWTPLLHAIHKFRRSSVGALLDAGADPNARSTQGFTPLAMAAGYGDSETVRLLLAGGASPRDPSALAAAVTGVSDIDKFTLGDCQTDTVQALLDAAPDLRLPDTTHGRWALRLASLADCTEVVRAVAHRR